MSVKQQFQDMYIGMWHFWDNEMRQTTRVRQEIDVAVMSKGEQSMYCGGSCQKGEDIGRRFGSEF
jgi:hypothetical protein